MKTQFGETVTKSRILDAIAKRCCVRPWRLPLGEAQIAPPFSPHTIS